jgi:hypothetical protein
MKTKKLYEIIAMAALAFGIAMRPADVLKDTGVTMTHVRTSALMNMENEGELIFHTNGLMREASLRIPAGSRAATVRMLGSVVRSYVESDAFAQAYRQSVESRSSLDETYSDANVAQQAAQVEGADNALKMQMAATQQAFATLDPDMVYMAVQGQVPQLEAQAASEQGAERQAIQQQIAQTKKLLAAHAGNHAEFKKQYLVYVQQVLQQGAEKNVQTQREELATAQTHNAKYRQQKAEIEAKSNYRPRLRKQLQAFVNLCNSVDFNAKLEARGSRQEFVNPAYRNQSSEWKLLFRMGKEPVMAARDFARQWLADLNK